MEGISELVDNEKEIRERKRRELEENEEKEFFTQNLDLTLQSFFDRYIKLKVKL